MTLFLRRRSRASVARSIVTLLVLTLFVTIAPATHFPELLQQSQAAPDGLNGYFRNDTTGGNDVDLSSPFTSQTCTTSKLTSTTWDWGTGGPSGCNADDFTGYYTGYILGPKTGTVNFSGSADDVLIVRINGTAVVKKYLNSGTVSGSFNFTEGVAYPIQIWFHEVGGGAAWALNWDASGSAAVIGSSYLGSTAANLLSNQYQTGTCQVGYSAECPAYSPQEIYNLYGTVTDGNYWIMTGGSPSYQYVLMQRSFDSGGWILSMKANKTSTNYDWEDTYRWTTQSIDNSSPLEDMATTPARISGTGTGTDGKYEAFNTLYAQKIRAVFPEFAASSYGGRYTTNNNYGFMWEENLSSLSAGPALSSSYPTATYPLAASQNCTGISTITLNNLFANSKRCLFRTPAYARTAGNDNTTSYDPIGNNLFASQNWFAWWGINYTQPVSGGSPTAYHHSRFGFGWNENSPTTDEGSNDVAAGIGLFKASTGSNNWPTGSYVGCCASQTGQNKQMAFEIYLRQSDPSLAAPTGLAATATSATSVNLTWSAPASTTPTEYVVQYKTNAGSWDANVSTVRILAPGSSPSASITGLTAGTVYTFRVFARTIDLTTKIYDTNSSATPAYLRFGYENRAVDTAFTFGGNQFFQSASEAPFDIPTGTTYSLEAWIRTTTLTGSQIIAGKNGQYSLYIANNSIGFNLYTTDVPAGVGGESVYFGASSAKTNEWQHVAVTRSGTRLKCYLNGALVSNTTIAANGSIKDGSAKFTVGGYSATDQPFSGQIDQVRVWSAERTLSEINDGMNKYIPSSTTGLLASYGFNEGTGSTSYDISSQNSTSTDLSLTGGSSTWWSVAESSTAAPYTTFKFTRSILNAAGGWQVPESVTRASAIVVGGGGGGGFGDTNNRPAGGGGGGGVTVSLTQSFTPGTAVSVIVGVGGLGGFDTSTASVRNGQSSTLGVGGGLVALGGGGGGNQNGGLGAGGSTVATGGGSGSSGYTCSGSPLSPSGTLVPGATVDSGNNGSGGIWGWGGSGGGARGAASNGTCTSTNAGVPGPGYFDPITNIEYGRGGSGDAYSTTSLVTGNTTQNNGWGGIISYSGGNSTGVGYRGSSGTIIIRYITATKPTYTKPTNAYLNAGMTETFTTNVLSDSATVGLTRTFRWESTTTGSTGSFSLIKQGTGAANASFAWIPPDTSTSGSNYLYRLIVTDSDTAGLFITDSSTAFAIINGTLNLISKSTLTKTVGVSKTETFTVSAGTPTYRYSLTPTSPYFWLDTSTVGSPRIRFADTVTVGTYYETFTVTDSVSASITVPLTIIVSTPPSFSASSALVDSSTVLFLDAGNSASYPGSGSTWNDISGQGLVASLPPLAMPAQNGSTGLTCTTPSISYSGSANLIFNGTSNCGYVPNIGVLPKYTYEVWFKRTGADNVMSDYSSIIASPWSGLGKQINITLHWRLNGNLVAGIWNGSAWIETTQVYVASNSWNYVAVTYDGSNLLLSLNGVTATKYSASGSVTWDAANNDKGLLIGKRFDQNGYFFSGAIGSIRIYDRVLTDLEIQQNYNATKNRFAETLNENAVRKKYGSRFVDTYTVTSGSESITATFTNNALAGVKWDTSTARSIVLTLQDSLTPGTYYDTITATDIYGSSSRLPLTFTIAKADTLTVSMDTATVVSYNASPITVYPKARIRGLIGSDTATSLTRFSSTLYTESTVVPTNADTYTVRGATPTFTVGSLSYYEGVIYETTTATVNKINQRALNVFMYGGVVGSPYLIYLAGGSGTGAVTETLTGVSSLTGCAISNHFLTASEQKQGFCEVRVVKAADQNYFAETQTVQLYFMAYINNQPTGLVGSGSGIGLNGVTSFDTSTASPPSITQLSTLTLSLSSGGNFTITGTGFTGAISVKFWRNKSIDATSGNGTTIVIPVSAIASAGATSGRIAVITAAGQAISVDSLTITP